MPDTRFLSAGFATTMCQFGSMHRCRWVISVRLKDGADGLQCAKLSPALAIMVESFAKAGHLDLTGDYCAGIEHPE